MKKLDTRVFFEATNIGSLCRLDSGYVWIGTVFDQHPHCVNIKRVGSAPERCCAIGIQIQVGVGVFHKPQVFGEPRIGVDASIQQCLHQFQVSRLLLQIGLPLWKAGLGQPPGVDHCIKRRSTSSTGQCWICASL